MANFTQQDAEKLHALRKVAEMLGMLAPCKGLRPSRVELERRLAAHGIEMPIYALFIIASEETSHLQKTAAGYIVEYFWPTFWEDAPPSLIGSLLTRNDARVLAWRKSVLRRDGGSCRKCGNTKELHAHHIVRWADAPALRIEVGNGITLCRGCHEEEHNGQRAKLQRESVRQ